MGSRIEERIKERGKRAGAYQKPVTRKIPEDESCLGDPDRILSTFLLGIWPRQFLLLVCSPSSFSIVGRSKEFGFLT
jgi:hypothetical protein